MLELTRRERTKLSRIADKLYRDGVGDEHKAAALYRRLSKELRNAGLYMQADALDLMAGSAEVSKDILNEIIEDIREQVIVSQFKKETTLKGDRPFVSMVGRLSKRR